MGCSREKRLRVPNWMPFSITTYVSLLEVSNGPEFPARPGINIFQNLYNGLNIFFWGEGTCGTP